jgi:hypothetical protein
VDRCFCCADSGSLLKKSGGEIGIRTLDRLPPILDFESSAFDHSAISPLSP